MKLKILFGAVTLISQILFSMEEYRPRFLVEKQVMPYTLKISGECSFNPKVVFSGEVDGLFIPFVVKKNLLFLGGGGISYENTAQSPAYDLQGSYISLFGTGGIGKKVFWMNYHILGSFTSKDFGIYKKSVRYGMMVLAGYKYSDKFSVGLGIFFSTGFGKVEFFPVPLISWSHKDFYITIAPPGKLEFRGKINEKLGLIGGVDYKSYKYYEKADDVVGYSYVMPFAGIDISLGKVIVCQTVMTLKTLRKKDFRISGKTEEMPFQAGIKINLLVVIE